MLFSRDGLTPDVHPTAIVAESASIVGNVTVGARCYVGHGAVVESSGPPVVLEDECMVLANAVVRSVGGRSRPPFPVRIGARTLVAPGSVLTGCILGARCYIATGALAFHGAEIGDDARVAVGAIVHHHARVPTGGRVGIREIVVASGPEQHTLADGAHAHDALGQSDFFGRVFGAAPEDQRALHDWVLALLHEEVHAQVDRRVG